MKESLIKSFVLAVAIVIAGLCIGGGLKRIATKDRIVAAKGLDTRDVQADFVVWPMTIALTGNDLVSLNERVSASCAMVEQFLVEKGFRAEDISRGYANVNNNWEYGGEHRTDNHYTVSSTIVVQTADVERVLANIGSTNELLTKGVLVRTNTWEVDYQFNGLNAIKPEMVERATKNARTVALKFAEDAGCSLGSIAYANQGQFSVTSDSYQPWLKHVRVVTTVNYYLK